MRYGHCHHCQIVDIVKNVNIVYIRQLVNIAKIATIVNIVKSVNSVNSVLKIVGKSVHEPETFFADGQGNQWKVDFFYSSACYSETKRGIGMVFLWHYNFNFIFLKWVSTSVASHSVLNTP